MLTKPIESQLASLFNSHQTIFAIEAALTERQIVIKLIEAATKDFLLPLFYWNPGNDNLFEVDRKSLSFIPREKTKDALSFLDSSSAPGVYIIEGSLAPDLWDGTLSREKIATISNLAFKLMSNNPSQWVIFKEPYLELPQVLSPLIPVVTLPLPDYPTVLEILINFCLTKNFDPICPEQLSRLTLASIAIPRGELEIVLKRLIIDCQDVGELAASILDYKKQKFRGMGVEFISKPDVPKAAGLELLDQAISLCAALLKPEASQHNLTFPRGMLLWGIPGTGKSLSAKLAASKIGVPLVAADWGGLRGNTAYESRRNLKEFLATCDTLGKEGLILYFDDFDKGFAGYNNESDGGISRQLAGKLLTWMQEHTSKVLVLATINNLSFLPPELIRRFEENIFFVDLPHAGARYEIFKLHMAKYFPGLDFEEKEWRRLLAETHLLTPAEIGNLVKRTACEAFYRNVQLGRESYPLSITVSDLIEQRYLFTPSAIRDEDQIVAIRNQAGLARPSGLPDSTVWARKQVPLFGD